MVKKLFARHSSLPIRFYWALCDSHEQNFGISKISHLARQKTHHHTKWRGKKRLVFVPHETMKVNNSAFPRELRVEDSQTKPGPTAPRKKKHGVTPKLLGTLLLFDLPLTFLFTLFVSTFVFQRVMLEYLVPQCDLLKWKKPRDYTYYHRPCDEKDITTNKTADLIVSDAKDAVEITLTHGASVYPQILSDATAQELRNYIMDQNKVRKGFDFVIQPKKRRSYGMTPNEHPSVSKAIREILSNKLFRSSIEEIAGKDPAIVECTQITR